MSPQTRWALLIALLGLSAGLVFFGETPSPNVVAAVDTRSSSSLSSNTPHKGKAPTTPDLIQEIVPRAPSAEPTNAFALHDWSPPPPSPPPPAPPTAPPLPFTYLGKQVQDGVWTIFLGRQNYTYTVKEHDNVDSLYSVDSISPPHMTFTFLPLQQQQTLAIGPP